MECEKCGRYSRQHITRPCHYDNPDNEHGRLRRVGCRKCKLNVQMIFKCLPEAFDKDYEKDGKWMIRAYVENTDV